MTDGMTPRMTRLAKVLKLKDGEHVTVGVLSARVTRHRDRLTQVEKKTLVIECPAGAEVRIGCSMLKIRDRIDRYTGSTSPEMVIEAPMSEKIEHHKAADSAA